MGQHPRGRQSGNPGRTLTLDDTSQPLDQLRVRQLNIFSVHASKYVVALKPLLLLSIIITHI